MRHLRPTARALRGLGLPAGMRACLLDLDGVLTDTTPLHAAAWKDVLDEVLARRARERGGTFAPFDKAADYAMYVDGRRSEDGARAFLASRGIALPEGDVPGSPHAETVTGIGKTKSELVLERMRRDGVKPFDDAVRYVHEALARGLRCGVVSSSTSCREALAAAGISGLFEVVVDAQAAAEAHLAGKPAPDTYLEGARALAVSPHDAAVFDDAPAGVAAGRAGGFGYVVGVDRRDRGGALTASGADVVIPDLDALRAGDPPRLTPRARPVRRRTAR